MTETQDIATERSDIIKDEENETDIDNEPSHHARRPMNAFLIFCKRHRSVVREKYPTHENRTITKILGEWWANLDNDEKSCYTGLAKQYKDAFFTAHPDFKWYKLPAPPLRTFATRPGNNTNIYTEQENYPIEIPESNVKQTNNNHLIKINFNVPSTSKHLSSECQSIFTPGKLADVTQMGGLNSLIVSKESREVADDDLITDCVSQFSTPVHNTSSVNVNPSKNHPLSERSEDIRNFYNREDASPPSQDETSIKMQKLQDELSKTSRLLELSFENSNESDNSKINLPDKELNNSYSEHNDSRSRNEPHAENDEKTINKNVWLNSFDKSRRACKGKRYQEFMANSILTVNKRPKKEFDNKIFNINKQTDWKSFRESDKSDLNHKDSKTLCDKAEMPKSAYDVNDTGQHAYDQIVSDQSRENTENLTSKMFKASDFDLDAKIKALPSLSLEKFQQRKKENKKRKKTLPASKHKVIKPKPPSTDNRTQSSSNHQSYYPVERSKSNFDPVANQLAEKLSHEVVRPIDNRMHLAEEHKSAIIGSRKRKPRKVSITRNLPMKLPTLNNTEIPIRVVPTSNVLPDQNLQNLDDICGLATLAEVAAKMHC